MVRDGAAYLLGNSDNLRASVTRSRYTNGMMAELGRRLWFVADSDKNTKRFTSLVPDAIIVQQCFMRELDAPLAVLEHKVSPLQLASMRTKSNFSGYIHLVLQDA